MDNSSPAVTTRNGQSGAALGWTVTAGLALWLVVALGQLCLWTGVENAARGCTFALVWWLLAGSRTRHWPVVQLAASGVPAAAWMLMAGRIGNPPEFLIWTTIVLGGSLTWKLLSPAFTLQQDDSDRVELVGGDVAITMPRVAATPLIADLPPVARIHDRPDRSPARDWIIHSARAEQHTAERVRDRGEPAFLTQSITRTIGPHGDELCAELPVVFAAGERQVWLHLPFVPRFQQLPDLECEVDEAGAAVDVDRILPYGVRLKVRRQYELSQPRLLLVRVTAIAALPAARVA